MRHRPSHSHTETEIEGVTRYCSGGVRIYRIPVESYPGHTTNVYLVVDGAQASLIDVGLNSEKGQSDLTDGFATIAAAFREDIRLDDVRHIVITHGHDDHFGLLAFDGLKGRTLYISGIDCPMITDYRAEDRKWRRYCRELAREAGCRADPRSLWPFEDLSVRPGDYDVVTVADGQQIVNGYRVIGTPGHTPGHICIGIGATLFLGDHVLSATTPHQVPRSGWAGSGLAAYLQSLRRVAGLGMELGLPSHEDAIYSIGDRARQIERFHHDRLDELVPLCRREQSLYHITRAYYRRHREMIGGSTVDRLEAGELVMALEEVKAHLEYLEEQGRLESRTGPDGVIRYRSSS